MKVAIVGGAPRSMNLAPYDDKEWEIWGLGVHIKNHNRLSLVFEIHPEFEYETEDYPERLVSTNIPLIVHENFPFRNEQIEVYPFSEANKILDGMLTSSLAYMMAYAILKGATEISIYGVDMDVDDKEYFYQRPGMYAWIGYAKALGIKVNIPESSLFKDKNYPNNVNKDITYNEQNFLNMADMHQKEIDKYNDKIANLTRLVDTHSGCKQVYTRLAKIARATDAGIEVEAFEHSTVIRS